MMNKWLLTILTLSSPVFASYAVAQTPPPAGFNTAEPGVTDNIAGAVGAAAKCPNGVCDAYVKARSPIGPSEIFALPSDTGENDYLLPESGATVKPAKPATNTSGVKEE